MVFAGVFSLKYCWCVMVLGDLNGAFRGTCWCEVLLRFSGISSLRAWRWGFLDDFFSGGF